MTKLEELVMYKMNLEMLLVAVDEGDPQMKVLRDNVIPLQQYLVDQVAIERAKIGK